MIPLINTTPHTVQSHAEEMGFTDAGQLITPTRSTILWPGRFAVDNACYTSFDPEKYIALLTKLRPHRDRCIFVVVPDVVGSARRTNECFSHWYPRVQNWPVAYVAQDGCEDLEIPWRLVSCLFVGGTDNFKLSDCAEHVIRAAKIMGKWVHVGRINSYSRHQRFAKLGADSFDGTGLTMFREEREKFMRGMNRAKGSEMQQEIFAE